MTPPYSAWPGDRLPGLFAVFLCAALPTDPSLLTLWGRLPLDGRCILAQLAEVARQRGICWVLGLCRTTAPPPWGIIALTTEDHDAAHRALPVGVPR